MDAESRPRGTRGAAPDAQGTVAAVGRNADVAQVTSRAPPGPERPDRPALAERPERRGSDARGRAWPVAALVILAALAFLLAATAHVSMIDTGSEWQTTVHMLLRALGAFAALAAGVLKLASYVGQRHAALLIVGGAFLGVGLVEAGRTVALLIAEAYEVFTPLAVAGRAGWAVGIALPALLALGMAVLPQGDVRRHGRARATYLAGATLIVAAGVFGPWLDVLPGTIIAGAVVPRPDTAWTIAIYLVVFVLLWRRRDVLGPVDGRWLGFALYLAFLDQVLVAPFWLGIGTGPGTVDAILKLATYLTAGIGVLIGTTLIARDQQAAVARFRDEALERRRVEAALARQAAELETANDELSQFAYLASHDLQEPLRMVTNYLQLIERRYGEALDDDGHEFIGFAVDGARRMKQLTNDLLSYSRIGDHEAAGEPASAEEALADALRNLEVLIEETGASVTHDPLPEIAIDRVGQIQLFQNLIGNALKFRREDVAPRIHVAARPDGNAWHFTVADNGLGIAPKYHDRVFGIFQRLHRRDAYSGSGIGLALSRKIVARHDGRIWFESVSGEGTTFHWTAPGDRPLRVRVDGDDDPQLSGHVESLIARAREMI